MEPCAKFDLKYKDLLIGTLTFQNKVWTFNYSEEFKNQSQIQLLIGFSDVNRVYVSEELLPFFAARITSIQRLKVQKMITENEALDEVNSLKKFGKKSIANPFELVASQ
jgi:hypothetical protein